MDNPEHDNYRLEGTELNQDRQLAKRRIRDRDKSDFATFNEVFDWSTERVISKFINQAIFNELGMCISTGKEACVFHAQNAEGKEYAIKIFRTSVLKFKDREKYVTGDYRFQNSYSKSSNHRKMVFAWARKEMINLMRLFRSHIKIPRPVKLKNNVLVLEFLGEEGIASPRLREHVFEASLNETQKLYYECLLILKRMYYQCKMVHADFSEYNMMVHNGELFVFDVSQAVDNDHPLAFEFLKRDLYNISMFFKKSNPAVNVMALKKAFDFITRPEYKPNLTPKQLENSLKKLIEQSEFDFEVDDLENEVFKNSEVPTNLYELNDQNTEKEIENYINGTDSLFSRLLPNSNSETNFDDSSDDDNDEDEDSVETNADQKNSDNAKAKSSRIRFSQLNVTEKFDHKEQIKRMKKERKLKKKTLRPGKR